MGEWFVITDRLWRPIAPLLPGKATDRVTARDNRLFLEAVLWKVRTGAPWRDLPPCFGTWNSQFRRFRRWAEAVCFRGCSRPSAAILEYMLIDGTIVPVHQQAAGAKGARSASALAAPAVG